MPTLNKQWLTCIHRTDTYFTVYDNNTNLLGKVEDSELRKNIVVAYSQAKFPHYKFPNGVRFKESEVEKWLNRKKKNGRDEYKRSLSI